MKFNYHNYIFDEWGDTSIAPFVVSLTHGSLSHYFLPSRVIPSSFEKENTIGLCYC